MCASILILALALAYCKNACSCTALKYVCRSLALSSISFIQIYQQQTLAPNVIQPDTIGIGLERAVPLENRRNEQEKKQQRTQKYHIKTSKKRTYKKKKHQQQKNATSTTYKCSGPEIMFCIFVCRAGPKLYIMGRTVIMGPSSQFFLCAVLNAISGWLERLRIGDWLLYSMVCV